MTERKARYRVTSFDVAERAGVSQSTVSRALAGSSAITEPTRARVMKAAEELGYVVDERAARLRRGKTGTLAVVVIGRADASASGLNPFHFSLLGSVCAAGAKQGYETLVSFQSEEGQFFGKYEERGQADAMIVMGSGVNDAAWDYFRELSGNGRSVAYWSSPFDELDWVRSDNVEGGVLATTELLEAGCQHVVHIGSADSAQKQFGERNDGYAKAMTDRGLEPVLFAVDEALDREGQGRKAAQDLIKSGIKFDGIFVATDTIAMGVLEALGENGISVPNDCSVIGFDGLRAGEYSNPPLTTVEPDIDVAGAMLVRTALRGGDTNERRVPVGLLHRRSVKRS